MVISILQLLITFILAYLFGKIITKIKMPAILGWLIAGMILGPHALSLMNESILEQTWYKVFINILECTAGLMIGTELVFKRIKKYGISIIITTLTQSLGTFLFVSLMFAIIFYMTNIPIYLSIIFGGIALATAPAPALSVVREYETNGPVTRTLIPMAVLDDMVGVVVFFSVMAFVMSNFSQTGLPSYIIVLTVLLPVIIGIGCGLLFSPLLKKKTNRKNTLIVMILSIILTSIIGLFFNYFIMPRPMLNFMIIGMAFSATFSNMVQEDRLDHMISYFNPILGIALIFVILNLGMPLDYALITGAGLYTVIYILARAIGKYFGAYFGASITKLPNTVKKYLGFTLLPHSGVSLVFTGIAVNALKNPAPESAKILQGTIAAAAVINEIIAVLMAKKGFEWANELNNKSLTSSKDNSVVITISSKYGSGGLEIAQKLSKELNIPYYDKDYLYKKHIESNNEPSKSLQLFQDSLSLSTIQSAIQQQEYQYVEKEIIDLANKEDCIFLGRNADDILKNKDNLIKVFIFADFPSRVERVKVQYKIKGNIKEEMEKVDEMRSTFYNYYTKKRFGDANNYNICLDSSSIGINNCISIIKDIYMSKKR
ncbi:cytidylate kinase family protein [Anaerococcus sp. AGMB00486]|uniref:Cytidylate kinase family protein n=1 Tax=Anaerococcus faecalis TaxID=2742993 RepID=A0ABX2N9M9_9FIRM|nr:cytidylate kinase family protein [Anaerococcus faecalis]NVF11379.1 cytidylate kinase family protein [Anaerococcus faecalis]